MGKKKQKSKSMMMEDKERLRPQTDLVGQETQHLATVGTGGTVVRQLHGRSIPIPPPPIPPDTSRTPPNSDPIESFDPGIPPTDSDIPCSQTVQQTMANVPVSTPISPQLRQKPTVPPRPAHLGSKDTNTQGVSSEMESVSQN